MLSQFKVFPLQSGKEWLTAPVLDLIRDDLLVHYKELRKDLFPPNEKVNLTTDIIADLEVFIREKYSESSLDVPPRCSGENIRTLFYTFFGTVWSSRRRTLIRKLDSLRKKNTVFNGHDLLLHAFTKSNIPALTIVGSPIPAEVVVNVSPPQGRSVNNPNYVQEIRKSDWTRLVRRLQEEKKKKVAPTPLFPFKQPVLFDRDLNASYISLKEAFDAAQIRIKQLEADLKEATIRPWDFSDERKLSFFYPCWQAGREADLPPAVMPRIFSLFYLAVTEQTADLGDVPCTTTFASHFTTFDATSRLELQDKLSRSEGWALATDDAHNNGEEMHVGRLAQWEEEKQTVVDYTIGAVPVDATDAVSLAQADVQMLQRAGAPLEVGLANTTDNAGKAKRETVELSVQVHNYLKVHNPALVPATAPHSCFVSSAVPSQADAPRLTIRERKQQATQANKLAVARELALASLAISQCGCDPHVINRGVLNGCTDAFGDKGDMTCENVLQYGWKVASCVSEKFPKYAPILERHNSGVYVPCPQMMIITRWRYVGWCLRWCINFETTVMSMSDEMVEILPSSDFHRDKWREIGVWGRNEQIKAGAIWIVEFSDVFVEVEMGWTSGRVSEQNINLGPGHRSHEMAHRVIVRDIQLEGFVSELKGLLDYYDTGNSGHPPPTVFEKTFANLAENVSTNDTFSFDWSIHWLCSWHATYPSKAC